MIIVDTIGMSVRPIRQLMRTKPTVEGAGVRLQRAFGFGNTAEFDPFLLFDDFRNDNPDDYLAGFPWHPHRGIETITYVLAGSVEHGDSLGNRGRLGAGDVQWMTAGRGIAHSERTPDVQRRDGQKMLGLQSWIALPAGSEEIAPSFQHYAAEALPTVRESGFTARIKDNKLEGVDSNAHIVLPDGFGEAKIACKVSGGKLDEVTADRPLKRLTVGVKRRGGRNNIGWIAVRHRGGIEEGQVRCIPLADQAARVEAEVPGRQRGHLPDRLFQPGDKACQVLSL